MSSQTAEQDQGHGHRLVDRDSDDQRDQDELEDRSLDKDSRGLRDGSPRFPHIELPPGATVDTPRPAPTISAMLQLSWVQVTLLQFFVGLMASGVAGLMVGYFFDWRQREYLRRFQTEVLDAFLAQVSRGVDSLASNAGKIPEMADSIKKLGPLLDRLVDVVEKCLKLR